MKYSFQEISLENIDVQKNKLNTNEKSLLSYSDNNFNNNKLILIKGFESINKKIEKLVTSTIKNNINPIIIISNNILNFSSLFIKKCIVVKLIKIQSRSIEKRLQYIAEKENLNIDSKIIEQISIRSNGDVRYAIKNLQAYTTIKIHDVSKNIYFLKSSEYKNKYFQIDMLLNLKTKYDIFKFKEDIIINKYIFI